MKLEVQTELEIDEELVLALLAFHRVTDQTVVPKDEGEVVHKLQAWGLVEAQLQTELAEGYLLRLTAKGVRIREAALDQHYLILKKLAEHEVVASPQAGGGITLSATMAAKLHGIIRKLELRHRRSLD